jgi:23S rRNA (cytosine1962-C5)-methyltransferase
MLRGQDARATRRSESRGGEELAGGTGGQECPRSCTVFEAEPLTGRTHQIRVHAAARGLPILGDTLYGGTPAPRVCLHAAELTLQHPVSGAEMSFSAPAAFEADTRFALRAAIVEPGETNACRLLHGASDGQAGWYVERFGDYLLSQSGASPSPAQCEELARLVEIGEGRLDLVCDHERGGDGSSPVGAENTSLRGRAVPAPFTERVHDFKVLERNREPASRRLAGTDASWKLALLRLMERFSARGACHKVVAPASRAAPAAAVPQLLLGTAPPERFTVRENGVQFEIGFSQGSSVGLFLDQRDNRRRLLTGHVAAAFPLVRPTSTDAQSSTAAHASPPRVLNMFAYTCAFSVCAACAGALTTSLDLSRNYLEWGRRNFALNQLDPAGHEFICGEAFDWLRRLAKKQRRFDVVLLDPPTFSQSKASGVFRAEKDYGRLVAAALPLLAPGGVLFASTNASEWPPEKFLAAVEGAIRDAGRRILQRHYAPQPPDFPISRLEPGYLKTVWLRLG